MVSTKNAFKSVKMALEKMSLYMDVLNEPNEDLQASTSQEP